MSSTPPPSTPQPPTSRASTSRPCPRCQASVAVDAIACPRCHTPFKALGHTGIPLHQAATGEILCHSCIYDKDDSCTYPNRSVATSCVMYVDEKAPAAPEPLLPRRRSPLTAKLQDWTRRNLGLVLLISVGAILLFSLLSGG